MVERIKINNFALIKSLELNFESGFNVLLGETGAGKSIIIDALNFLLGAKADKTQIRSGEDCVKVSGVFSVNNKIRQVLSDLGFESDVDELLISRSFNQAGKGEVRINGEFATVSILKDLGSSLIDCYNQNDQVELAKAKNHIRVLDSYNPELYNSYKADILACIEKIKLIDEAIKKLGGSEDNRVRQIDILEYQINEIETANLKDGEMEEIEDTLSKISSSEKVINAITELNNVLAGEELSLISAMNSAYHKISSLTNLDSQLDELAERLQSISIDMEDVAGSLNEIYDKFSFDEQKINALIARREEIDGLKRKYGKTYNEICLFLEKAKTELDTLLNATEKLGELRNERLVVKQKLYAACEKLSRSRRENALTLETLMENGLKEVGIKNSRFKVIFNDVPAFENFETFVEDGFDIVEFMFSANLGEELKPLSKIISGGEMSRFMLVLKNILAETGASQTIIFDEIDSGISGEIADEVANKIESLSKKYQIICITHLPQVAAKGDNFIFVYKSTENSRTETHINILNEDEIEKQIAKMASGNVTETSIKYARELITRKI